MEHLSSRTPLGLPLPFIVFEPFYNLHSVGKPITMQMILVYVDANEVRLPTNRVRPAPGRSSLHLFANSLRHPDCDSLNSPLNCW